MKKYFAIFFAISILASSIVVAQNDPPRLKMSFEIIGVLSDLGLSPKMSKDNVIDFSYEKESYSFEYNQEEEGLYYGSILKHRKYSDEITPEEIRNFNEGYNYKTVKVVDNGSGFVVRSEFYFDDKEVLKRMCPQLLRSMSRTMKALKRSAAAFSRDSLLTVSSFKPVAVFADSTETSVTALASIEATYPGDYVVGMRIYRNNTLMCLDEACGDYTKSDTLTLENKNTAVKLSTCVTDSISKEDRLRYELWHNGKCIAAEVVINKTIE